MSILLRKVKIIDPQSPFNKEVKDILIEHDQITQIADHIDVKAKKVISEEGLCVSPGWFELHSDFSDPGNEHKEDFESGARASVYGGFTSVVLTPNTHPVVQTKGSVEYLYKKAENLPINIFPLGASTNNLEGKELAELYDMFDAGAIGFYNDKNAIEDPNIQRLIFLYARTFNAPILVYPNQRSLSENGQMNEGETSTFLALKGIPNLSEELIISRDLYLAEYTESSVHFTSISSAGSVELIRNAKQKGIKVTCSVNLYSLVLTDKVLTEYDTRYKVLPPLRTELDRRALIDGLKEGAIDAIAIDHIPQDIELKKCEFEHAAFGMRGLETAAGIFGKYLAKELGWENWVKWISHNPREILNAPNVAINNGTIAELTLFKPKEKWNVNLKSFNPKSKNNPFYKEDLVGKAFGIINNGAFYKS